MSEQEPGRVLTLEQLRKKGACEHGRRVFRKMWGKQAVVNQAWARQASVLLGSGDASWLAIHMLPQGWAEIAWHAWFSALPAGSRVGGISTRSSRVSFAVFAALYVEAGKP